MLRPRRNSIRREVLRQKRADFGDKIVSALGRQLEREFGRGFSKKSLRHMIRFAAVFPNREILSTLLRQLSCSHFLAIIYIKDPLQRGFCAELCRIARWSTRALRRLTQQAAELATLLSTRTKWGTR
ncbi:MAG: hypothetical protein HY017_13725 [Betaproteobacteria bacterium]|nr:hypothetical protein [Betaproteobacteria bacterium]